MPSTFKYAESKFNHSLLTEGGIRVGTLYDFRNTEHKDGIADAFEGKKLITHYAESASSNDVDSIHTRALSAYGAVKYGPNVEIVMQGATFIREINHPDMYVYCVSSVYSKKTASQFPDADSCVEIHDQNCFYNHITEALNKITPVDFLGFQRVRYMDRNQSWNGFDWDESINPALIKEFEFSDQFEVRACWLPKEQGSIKPEIFKCPEISKYCIPRLMPAF